MDWFFIRLTHSRWCLLLALIIGCATISQFDNTAYIQCTAGKIDVIQLMEKSTESYQLHVRDVKECNEKLMKNIEYEKNRPRNEITVSMYKILWKMLNDSTTVNVYKYGLFPEWQKTHVNGFFPMWQQKDTLHPAFISEAQEQIGEAFDLIAQLESKKLKADDNAIKNFIQSGAN